MLPSSSHFTPQKLSTSMWGRLRSGESMTKKKPSLSPIRHLFQFTTTRLTISVSLLCFLTLLTLHKNHHHSQLHSSSISRTFYKNTTTTNTKINNDHRLEAPSKLAFLFLARRNLPLDFLWGAFFKNGDAANFTIYIHSEPGFLFNESTTRSHFFYGRQLNKSVQVVWGESSMIKAEILLLKTALEDPSNQRFVLLSDSCVPLYNFSYIYNYVMSSPRSFVDSFLNAGQGHYNKKMSPVIPKDKWRKGSQWITLIRKHVEVVVDDDTVLPLFRKFCKRWRPFDIKNGRLIPNPKKQRTCIPDEHYVQTLFAMNGLEDELERRTLTYTLWNQTGRKMGKTAWHPITFNYDNASPQQIKEIKDTNHVYYESESRTEWCHVNSRPTPCFLFARKFLRGSAMRLLTEGMVGPFDVSALWNTSQ